MERALDPGPHVLFSKPGTNTDGVFRAAAPAQCPYHVCVSPIRIVAADSGKWNRHGLGILRLHAGAGESAHGTGWILSFTGHFSESTARSPWPFKALADACRGRISPIRHGRPF